MPVASSKLKQNFDAADCELDFRIRCAHEEDGADAERFMPGLKNPYAETVQPERHWLWSLGQRREQFMRAARQERGARG